MSKQFEVKPRILSLLIRYYPQALLSQHLATIHRDVPIEFDLDKCLSADYDKDKLKNLFTELGFTSLLRRFGVMEIKNGYQREDSSKSKTKIQKKDDQLKLL